MTPSPTTVQRMLSALEAALRHFEQEAPDQLVYGKHFAHSAVEYAIRRCLPNNCFQNQSITS